jgi:hypothetical protein
MKDLRRPNFPVQQNRKAILLAKGSKNRAQMGGSRAKDYALATDPLTD